LPRSFHFFFSLRELPIHTILGTRTPPRRGTGRVIVKVLVITLAVLVIAVGGCFVVMWVTAR